jgi:glycosyltransferase involved in cell wall biosynthesis
MSISLCMIVKNEADKLKPMLEAHNNYVDDIIIVDTGSTDNTKEIAKSFTDKVFDFKWCDDFSKARNQSLKFAKSDWILVLDADELVSPKDMEQIVSLSKQEMKKECYLFTQRHYCNEAVSESVPCSGEYPEYELKLKHYYESNVVRFFPKNRNLYFTYCVHELVEPQAERNSYRIVPTNILIHHYGQILPSTKDKSKFYIRLGEKKLKEHGENPKTYYELGLEYNFIGEHAKAAEMFSEAYELYHSSEILCERAFSHLSMHNHREAMDDFRESLKLNSTNYIAYVGACQLFLELDKPRQALIAIERAVALAPRNTKNLIKYAEVLEINGSPIDSIRVLKNVLKLTPNDKSVIMKAKEIMKKYKIHPGEFGDVD